MSRKNLIIFFLVFITQVLIAQNPFTNRNNGLITAMVSSFEDQICKYYNIDKEKSHIAYSKYIKDLSYQKENLTAITSIEELELLSLSKKELTNYIWITIKEKRKRSLAENRIIIDYNNLNEATKKYHKRLKLTDDIICVNYFDEYSKQLINSSENKNLKNIVTTLREVTDTSPYTTVYAFLNFKEERFKNNTLKTFIAFEFYYAILNRVDHNE
ncbi:hypothetical protein PG913_02715 [Tenacibaculum pacificus]|uniref:hypothetical protein n=1 Tax=Tenacibaculum pacificus TaxID=3018314 RepID=UPI0022F40806|nr:hypothetical protein [Tenacibaculum pacificus]WBX74157.1 hypothetical protein PG913_02715 [Tenacibaculum pacificus]